MPYQFNGSRRPSPQVGVGLSTWGTAKPVTMSESVLNAIPGALAWMSLALVLTAALMAPLVMLLGAALLAFYSAVRFVFAGVAVFIGLKHIREWEQIDWPCWYAEHATSASLPLDVVHHLVIIPNYREKTETLRASLQRLTEQQIGRGQISVMLAMESGEDGAREKGRLLKKEFEGYFAHFFVEVHPKGLHQEMQCKSANQAWATRWAKRRLVDESDYALEHIIVTTMDADTLWHKNYLMALSALFATDENRHAAFWQAPIRYHSNVWDVNPFIRLIHGYSTAWELAYLAAPWWQALPMSSYSLSLKLLDSAGYWDPDVIADEWHMYIKAYFKREGNLVLRPIFLPFSANATGGDNLLSALRQRYEQTLRHAWGAKEIGYTIAQIQNNPHQDRARSLHLLFRVAHDNLLAGAGWIILTAGTQLPALFHADEVQNWTGEPQFLLLQASFFVVTLLSLLFWWVDVRTRPARTHDQTMKERLYALISLPTLPIVTLICVALPVLHSQTRLMAGKQLQFNVTRKFF